MCYGHPLLYVPMYLYRLSLRTHMTPHHVYVIMCSLYMGIYMHALCLILCVPRCFVCSLLSLPHGLSFHMSVSLQTRPENELEEVVASGQEDAKASDVPTLKALGLPQPNFHSLILDLGALSFVDTVCIKSLKNVRG